MTLELEGVCRDYGSFRLGPVDLTVEPGVTAVLGPSGSGKSTLLSVIAGFERQEAGTVAIDGRPIDALPPEDRAVGMVFQSDALFPHLSVRENLAFGATESDAIAATAELLEIEDLLDREPDTLSGGEAQRVALARALVSDPEVLLLDEPLSSLDAPISRRLRVELRDVLADLEIPVVYVTHDQAEAAVLGDRLAVMNDGDLIREGPVEAVFDRPGSAFVAEFLGMENVFAAAVREVTERGTVVDVGPETLLSADEPPEGPVAAAIHPSAVDLDGEDTGEDAMTATVERILTRQTAATVILEWGGRRLTAAVDGSTAARLSIGEERRLRIDPGDVHLTRRDR
jgi:molybdate/tungstate transport system ATP-binding protein